LIVRQTDILTYEITGGGYVYPVKVDNQVIGGNVIPINVRKKLYPFVSFLIDYLDKLDDIRPGAIGPFHCRGHFNSPAGELSMARIT